MTDDQSYDEADVTSPAPTLQPVSIETAMPYVKAVGLLMTLMIVWAGLCTI